jgi:hypothetical protein
MKKNTVSKADNKLDTVIVLLQNLLALELYKNGVTMEDIGKKIHIAKAGIVEILKGVKKRK